MINLNQMVSLKQVILIVEKVIREAEGELPPHDMMVFRFAFSGFLGKLLEHAVDPIREIGDEND